MAKVLLVDDDEMVRQVVKKMLELGRHEVTEASNGVKALQAFTTASFDLVITDVVMPDMEGLQLVRELRALPSPPKVIVMSGGGRGTASDYLEMATRFGASATLSKPVSPQALVDAVNRVLAP
jgi:two-component system cell cycle response regulator CpdR